MVDVSDFSNNTGGINGTDAFDESERVWDSEYLIYGIRNDRWQSI